MLAYDKMTNEELLRVLPLMPEYTPLHTLLLDRLHTALDEVDQLAQEIEDLNAPLTLENNGCDT